MPVSRYQDDHGRRHYNTVKNGEEVDVLSVTTILDQMEKPQQLTDWQERNDGEGDNADHEHLLWYKANRGTLCHYAALSIFEDAHDEPELYSEDEAESEEELDNNHSPDKLYSLLKDKDLVENRDQFDEIKENIDLMDIYEEDIELFKNTFRTIIIQKGISQENILQIEKMFIAQPDRHGYGGQVDMVYEDPETGETVICDLKTSSAVHDKHLIQGSAYAHALKSEGIIDDYDKVEVIRIHPDRGSFEAKQMTGEEIEEKWEIFQELAEKAYNIGDD